MLFYPHHIGDVAAETAGLDVAHLGAYVRLLDQYARTETPIKTDWVSLGFQEKEVGIAKEVLRAFFTQTEGGWIHLGMAEIIQQYRVQAEIKRKNGQKGGRPKKSKPEGSLEKPDGSLEKPRRNQSVSLENPKETNRFATNSQGTKEPNKPVVAEQRACARTAASAAAHPFSYASMPATWADICSHLRPDLDADRLFAKMATYFTDGDGAGKVHTDASWTEAWKQWVLRERSAPAVGDVSSVNVDSDRYSVLTETMDGEG